MTIVILQSLAILAISVWVALRAYRQDRRVPIDDLGVMFLGILALYTAFPAMSWALQGGYDLDSNLRLFRLQPSPDDVQSILNIALAYAASFALIYAPRRMPTVPSHHQLISKPQMIVAAGILATVSGASLVLQLAGLIEAAESYIATYRVIQSLPLGLRQALRIGDGMAKIAAVVFAIGVLRRWPRSRWIVIAYLLLTLIRFDPESARSFWMLPILTLGIGWHILVRPIPWRRSVLGGVTILVLFSLLGLWRDSGEFRVTLDLGELDHIWANNVELLQTRERGGLDVPATVRFQEFVAFIPSQILPFPKLDVATWFLQEFYPSFQAEGGGLVFGAVAQVVIGGGIVEAVLRGVVLGFLASAIRRWLYQRPKHPWWHLPLYVYLLVYSYYTVRNTTFSLVGECVLVVLPALLLIAAGGRLLRVHRRTPVMPANPPLHPIH
jgi:hypothetical protein